MNKKKKKKQEKFMHIQERSLDSLPYREKKSEDTKSLTTGQTERISITMDKGVLKNVDAFVFNLKQQDIKTSRSQVIAEAVIAYVST